MGPEYLLTSLVLAVTPGTGVLYTVAAALARGARAGALAALACTLGIVPHAVAALTGLAALLHASAVAFEVVRYAGVAYLLYLAWSTLRETGALRVEPADRAPRPARRVLVEGIAVNLLNPKLTIFFVAFLPQFVDPGAGSAVPAMLGLSVVFMAVTLVVFLGYGALAARVRDRVLTRPRVMAWLRRTFAAAFVALGARLALADR
ncbi:LysE family translocator [Geodermatophilus normandii]|uniref:LysE family translocator n=1 Tax=Geodermatophilus normandii TaxID=1137989 RepID=A0A6P0GAV5_9ACTN|nr:LysE family translocator [Geodermatophilus normandii]NEM05143.1 LysE family translocator [Geodermatophilus normandii]